MHSSSSSQSSRDRRNHQLQQRRLGPIEYWAIETLSAYDGNARCHPKTQLDRLAASISEFGFTLPILVDPVGTIIAGHGRVQAARRLGIGEVPVVVARGWSPAQVRAFCLADNRLAELAEWDDELLAIELEAVIELDEVEFDALGWDGAEIELLLDGDPGSEERASDAEGPPSSRKIPTAQQSDVWRLGDHQLMCCSGEDEAPLVDPAFLFSIDAALRRWRSLTGEDAVLAGSGERFSEVAKRRAREGSTETKESGGTRA